MRMSAWSARIGRFALQLLPALLVVSGMIYLVQSTTDDRDAQTVIENHHFDRGITVKASSTPTPAPTTASTPQPTQVSPPPPLEPEPHQVYAPPPPPPPAASTPNASRYRTDWAQSILATINQTRGNAGLVAVAYDGALQSSADYYVELHSRIADVFALSHNLDGGPGNRAWARGYCCAVGEILATAEGSAQQVFDLWMGSPSHGAVILDGAYDHIGVSCYQAPYESATRGLIYPVICTAEFGNSN